MPAGRPKLDYSKEKAQLIEALKEGKASSLIEACKVAGLSYRTVTMWSYRDPEFRQAWQEATRFQTESKRSSPVPDYIDFRNECFGHETFPHQREWVEAIESSNRVLILVPPEHAKSVTVTVEYPVWRLAKDVNTRVIVVSKSQNMSAKWLYAIKKRLSDSGWYEMNGWRNPVVEWGPFQPRVHDRNLAWTQKQIYLVGQDSGEKDPSVEALGVGNQIQGARADLIILDDIATLKNMMTEGEREKILDWISQEVITRLGPTGKLVIIGTRVHEADIYSHFLDEDEPWLQGYTKVIRPAIIDEDKKEVLWPEGWPYESLAQRRSETKPRTWSLVYQQQATGMADSPFKLEVLEGCKDSSYSVGQVMPGLTTVMGVDPALSGYMAIMVTGLDRKSGMRYVIDIANRKELNQPEHLKQLVIEMAARYRCRECRVEKNAMQGFFSRDQDLRRRLAGVGCRILEEEYTGRRDKFDPDWGVMSIVDQFETGGYRLPGGPGSEAKMRPFIEQLASWRPGVKMTQDMVIALWLAELSARRHESVGEVKVKQDPRTPPWVRKKGWSAPPFVKKRGA